MGILKSASLEKKHTEIDVFQRFLNPVEASLPRKVRNIQSGNYSLHINPPQIRLNEHFETNNAEIGICNFTY